ncbi:MAG: DUF4212 domain-containing protein [Cyanobacteria bacterium P01_D01_bin.156]
MRDFSRQQSYWDTNVATIQLLLTAWGTVALGCSILIVDLLNQIQFFGLPLGFWVAQQGSILSFVGLTFFYAFETDELDKRYHSRPSDSKYTAFSGYDLEGK